jgi:hypothetical protein
LWAGLYAAEREYSTSPKLMDEEFKPLTGDSLLAKLSRSVAEILGTPCNPEVLIQVTAIAMEELRKANLPTLVEATRAVL